ncbi:MAG TPA: UDP-N-acetylmuramoyl-L-alanine--D-glutamate ligase [Bacteroidales bacterium]|nr:UDP-N-acetylmuramoyl-L-alanine--D-glutamate ligase [Bacteroidales bacterium]HSA44065.1 UDP-N-acetylmuramoyl-L-alanine--D-glutamate ligase [Bacteroidales bacterium]
MEKLEQLLKESFGQKQILILGFGKEGSSSLDFLMHCFPGREIWIADRQLNEAYLPRQSDEKTNPLRLFSGDNYLHAAADADVILKSPGIPYKTLEATGIDTLVTSQTELFIRAFGDQITGITGTKGKSTTASLLHHILLYGGKKSILAGNIGIPLFSVAHKVTADSHIVCELSCHQIYRLSIAPAKAVLLNIFPEHLDYYDSLEEYQQTKYHLAHLQRPGNSLVYNHDDPVIQTFIRSDPPASDCYPVSLTAMPERGAWLRDDACILTLRDRELRIPGIRELSSMSGEHNLLNTMAACLAAGLSGISEDSMAAALPVFNSLEHRLEDFGSYYGIRFYNDSISTIPQACIRALETLKKVHTLIVGGMDRGIDYEPLAAYLVRYPVPVLLHTGEAGKKIARLLCNTGCQSMEIREAASYPELVDACFRLSPEGSICLLSPAAASYDWFNNFEDRGNTFKRLVRNYRKEPGMPDNSNQISSPD